MLPRMLGLLAMIQHGPAAEGHDACSTCCKAAGQGACTSACRQQHVCGEPHHGLQVGGTCCTCTKGTSISGHCLAGRQQHSSRPKCAAGSLVSPAAIARPFKPPWFQCAACPSPVADRTAPAEQQRHTAQCSGHSRRGCSGQQRACSKAALPGTQQLQPARVDCGRGHRGAAAQPEVLIC